MSINIGGNPALTLSNNQVTLGGSSVTSVAPLIVRGGDIRSSNNMAYSTNGTTWIGLGATIFSICYGITWNGTIWVAGGSGTNTLAYSTNGTIWTGLGATIFDGQCNNIAWSGSMWVAVGSSKNTIAYSTNGTIWTGLGSSFFNLGGHGIDFNGNIWVAGGWLGADTYPIAYSTNGTIWTGITSTVTDSVNSVKWYYGSVAGSGLWLISCYASLGTTNNSILYSTNGTTWTGVGTSVLTNGFATAWNGSMWIAVGSIGSKSMAYSTNGTVWTGIGTTLFDSIGSSYMVTWNGTINLWIVVGGMRSTAPAYSTIYSTDGTNWNSDINLAAAKTGNGWAIASNYIYSPTSYNVTNGATTTTTINSLYVCIPSNVNIGTTNSSYALNVNGSLNTSSLKIYNNSYIGSLNINNNIIKNPRTNFKNIFSLPSGTVVNTSNVLANIDAYSKMNNPMTITYGASVEPLWVSGGQGTNTLAYSTDGLVWTGLGANICTTQTQGVFWNGTMWLAVGQGTNTLAYSLGGTIWTGLGATIFSIIGVYAAWNPIAGMWVAGGQGTNTIAYSLGGTVWTGLGATYTFSTAGTGIFWNGSMWVALGYSTNTIAYSVGGTIWTGLGATIFTTNGNRIVWNGKIWISNGEGTNTLAFSTNGTTWTGLGATIFTTKCMSIAWNGLGLWVAVGAGTNTIGYSNDGTTWTGLGATIFNTTGFNVNWNGSAGMWVAGGQGNNTLAYSYNGTTWTGLGSTIFTTNGYLPTFNNARSNAITFTPTLTTTVKNDKFYIYGGYNYNISYSTNGTTWTICNNSLFFDCNAIAFNSDNSLFVAVGSNGTHTSAYSTNGTVWTGLNSMFYYSGSSGGNGIAFNGNIWVATGIRNNAAGGLYSGIGYSTNGTTWTGVGTNIFSNGAAIGWDSKAGMWVATGEGNNTIAYSTNGTVWTGLGTTFLNINVAGTQGRFSVTSNGTMWIATGIVGTIWSHWAAYSVGGTVWTGLGTVFTYYGSCAIWNGTMWGAAGWGSNFFAYSTNGTSWSRTTISNFGSGYGAYGITWTGSMWILGGATSIAYSTNATTWTSTSGLSYSVQTIVTVPYSSTYSGQLGTIAGTVSGSNVTLSSGQTLEVVTDSYYQSGLANVSVNIQL